ncbi:MAG: hypothetical protein JWQ66_743 [Mucilaginibacter sp.]|nr:hypothetical protein [Mucilaginibacter sp.]
MNDDNTNEGNLLQCLLMDVQGLKSRIKQLRNRNPLFKFYKTETLLKKYCLSKKYFEQMGYVL